MTDRVWRVVYWFGSIVTDKYIRAGSKEDAEKKFRAMCGDRQIFSIEATD